MRLALGSTGITLAALLFAARPASADEPKPVPAEASAKDVKFFEQKVRPILQARCFECHGAEKQRGELRLDSRAATLAGGGSGEAVVPGKPDESLLVQAVRYSGDIKMPPRSKLPEAEIAVLVDWVARGAIWPDKDDKNPGPAPSTTADKDGPLFSDEARAFWAYQPVIATTPPSVRDAAWPKTAIDQFILAGLEAQGLSPAPCADKRTLIRRATLDLTGLPPTPAEVEAFLADDSPEAFSRVVDRLLDSPRYGERWGRHWLDVARYADSNGLDENLAYASAWRYRDYVIAAFNSDKQFDRFVQEQLAGDLLSDSGDAAALVDRITATGFLSLGGKMLAEDDPVKMQMDIVDEQVDTIGRAFLGLTLGCARCHAHKYDPIPQEDYYSLAGIFKSTKTMENFNVVARWQERPLAAPDVVARRDAHAQQIAAKKSEIAGIVSRCNEDLLADARRNAGGYLLAATRQRRLDTLTKARKPAGDDPAARERPGVILVEAEEFARGNVIRDRENYGKGIGVLVNKGELPNFTEYDVDVATAGLYQVELRYAAAQARPCKLFINGRLVKADVASGVTGTWLPDSQTWFIEGFYPLAAGRNVIRLEHPAYFPHIDKLLLLPATDDADQSLKPVVFRGPMGEALDPQPQFVAQWAAFLDRAEQSKLPVLAVWSEFARTAPKPEAKPVEGTETDNAAPAGDAPQPDHELSQAIRERLLADPRPQTLDQLAARYGELFAEAERAWQDLQKAMPDGKAAPLPDPVLEAFRHVLYDPEGPVAVPKNAEEGYSPERVGELKAAREQLAELEKTLPQLPEAMAVSEGKPENLRVHLRGSHLTLGRETLRQFPRILAGEQQTPIDDHHSGRLQFAEWLTSPRHPLTARVIVNRIWLWHFGEGIVRSPDNFGLLGERPTNPQLLDHLATEFVAHGWSIKAFHRLIMSSATYQMSTAFNEKAAGVDPENRLMWRMNRRRLEAESIRDSILFVAGTLDLTMGGSLLPTPNRQYVTSTANVNPAIYEAKRRSVYLPVVRSALYEVFQAFDFADPSTLNGRRDSTIVAPQALFMLNSRIVLEQSKALATQLLAEANVDDVGRIRRLYEIALSRPATEPETTRALAFVERYSHAVTEKGVPAGEQRLRAWQALCRTVLASNEFVYVE